MFIQVRGTKNDERDRRVPIVTDEQVVLLAFAREHAQGSGEKMFGSLNNIRRALTTACIAAKVEHIWPHALRHAAGQWLLDLGTPVEAVSRILGHASTSITERVYARMKREALADRMLDVLDPKYARAAGKARKKKERTVVTISAIPEPRAHVLYEVEHEEHTLSEWAQISRIPKSTLHHRLEAGLTMGDAIKLGRGTRGRPLAPDTQAFDTAALLPRNRGKKRQQLAGPSPAESAENSGNPVPRDGIEPPTRGFSIPCSTN